jgi:hypothetical protein
VELRWLPATNYGFFAATLGFLALVRVDGLGVRMPRAWLWAPVATSLPIVGTMPNARRRCAPVHEGAAKAGASAQDPERRRPMSREMSPSQLGQGQPNRMAGSARALDGRGKHLWRKPAGEGRHGARVAGYAVAMVVNLILIAIARSVPSWEPSFVTPAFDEVLPAIERSLVVAIVANTILCAYDAAWFRHLARAAMNAFALGATLALWRVYPFELGSPASNDFARIALLLVAIAVVIAIFAEVVQMLLALVGRRPEFDE